MQDIIIKTVHCKRLISFALLIIGLLVLSCNASKANEKKDIDMLQAFYQEYIIEQSKISTYNPQKVDSIKNIYCSAELLDNISQLELDYDPFLAAQDCDEGFLKRMTIKAETANPGVYEVIFDNAIINPDYKNAHIRLKVADDKIVAILGLTDKIKGGAATEDNAINESVDASDALENEKDLVSMLIPGGRYNPSTLETAIDNTWMEFYRDAKTGEYHVDKAQYTISTYDDECLGSKQGSLKSPRNCLFYVNMPALKIAKVDSVSVGRGYIEPKTPFVIDFNGSCYTLQVEAKPSENTPHKVGEEYGDWRDYQMTLKKDNQPEILLFKIPEFSNSVLRLLFAGDIDKDGKLDLVFDAHTWYEEANITVFLSSLAKDGVLVKAASFSIQYDC